MKVLVVGGAGYIGSHVVLELLERGYAVEVLDNLSTGFESLVPHAAPLHRGDAYNYSFTRCILESGRFDAVIHFAALASVPESVAKPRYYYERNVGGGLALLGACLDAGVRAFIFSSSAATYGEPQTVPIPEEHPRLPVNPYGATKVAMEQALEAYGRAYGMRWAALRYFNAAGAHPSGAIGEMHNPETHLIPNVLRAALSGEPVRVFGTDYPTRDGTCVRDYVHVSDLAEAHVLVLEALLQGHPSGAYNLGSQQGTTVMEVIEAARRVTRREIKVEVAPRREGDPAILIADSSKIRRELGWKPRFERIEDIISTAWNWHSRVGT